MRINVIGAGRVGRTILRLAALTPEVSVGAVYSRRAVAAREAVSETGQGRAVDTLADTTPADIWCIAVPDDQIAQAADDLARAGLGPSVAVHFSGYHPASVLHPLDGWAFASAHPNLSFADPESAASRFAGTLVAIEGDDAAKPPAERMMEAFGAECFRIGAEEKPLYHAAAVIANNFPVVLQALARETWEKAGVPEDMARRLGLSLLQAATSNLKGGDPGEVLTGPAARGDTRVVEVETQSLADWQPAAGDIYARLSRMAAAIGRGDPTTG